MKSTGVISNIAYCGKAATQRINDCIPENNFEFIIATSEYMYRKPNERIFVPIYTAQQHGGKSLKKLNAIADKLFPWQEAGEKIKDALGSIVNEKELLLALTGKFTSPHIIVMDDSAAVLQRYRQKFQNYFGKL